MKRLMQASRFALMLLCATMFAAEARADVKIKTRQTSNGQSSEGATYIKGKRQRTESNGGQMVVIQECDLRRDIQLMPQVKAYIVRAYDDAGADSATPANAARVNTATTKSGLVTSTITTRDTGERKLMFGYTARHIITTIVTKSSPDSCSPMDSKMEFDGWYIDAAFALDCDAARAGSYNRPQSAGGCQDRYQTKQIGAARKGLAVWEKMTMFGADGGESFSTLNEVVELSQATLDAALFEVPADYREVKDFSEAYANIAGAGDDGSSNNPVTSSTDSNAANVTPVAGATGAKRAGVIRLGLVGVTTGNVAEHINASELAAAVGNTLAARLNKSNVEVIRIEATMPFGIDAEAKRKECDFLIYLNVSHKKGGGGFGGMLGKVSSAIATAGSGDYAGGDEQDGAGATSAKVSASVKSKDELTLDLRMQSPTGASAETQRQFKAKAKSAGEDIISTVVEQAAQVVLGAAATK